MQTPPPAVGDSSNAFFFDNRVRAILRRDIMAAIIDGTPFFVLTGPDGSGKTTLISQLVAALPNGIESVIVNQTSHGCRRFDDVLVRLCQHIAIEPAWGGHPDARQIERIQEGIRDYLRHNGTRLLLILDQEEEGFPTMLERVWKMVEAVNGGTVIMHLLLIGRENLLAGLGRFIPDRSFTLPLLDEDDLPDFLRQWLATVRPDILEDAVSRRGSQMAGAEAGGRPGRLAALLEEKIDILTSGKTEARLHVPDKTGKAKRPAIRQGQKISAGFFFSALAERLRDALLAPPLLSQSRSRRAAGGKRRRAAALPIAPRFVSRTRLRRKNMLFWGKLRRQSQRLSQRFFAGLAHGAKNLKKYMEEAARAVSSTIANRPWAKNWQLLAHRPTALRVAIATTCGAVLAALAKGSRQLLPAANRGGLRKLSKIAVPPGVLKKTVVALVAICLAAVAVTALWSGLSRSPQPQENAQEQTPTLAEHESSPPASAGEEDILPVEKPADQMKAEEPEAKRPDPGATAASSIPTPPQAVAAMTDKKPERSPPTREVVKIAAGKKKKKIKLEPIKPIHILRAKAVKKVRL